VLEIVQIAAIRSHLLSPVSAAKIYATAFFVSNLVTLSS